jgi:energy-coupling factor transport system substrate-specific component
MTPIAASASGWRVVDIVVAAVLAVAFGVVFQVWNLVWAATGPAFVAFPPLQGFMYGVWLMPAVLVPLVIRRPGAALLAELVAASVSALIGSQWGLLTIVYGVLQGGAAEVVFALGLYRVWNLPIAIAAGAAAGGAAAILDILAFYPDWALEWQLLYVALVVPSAALVAGVGSWLLVRSLAGTGVLSSFPSGRQQEEV